MRNLSPITHAQNERRDQGTFCRDPIKVHMRTNRIIIAKFAPSAIFVRIVPLSQAIADRSNFEGEQNREKTRVAIFRPRKKKNAQSAHELRLIAHGPRFRSKPQSVCRSKNSVHCLSLTKLTRGTIATVAFRKCSCLFSAQSQVAFTNYFKPDFSDNYQ